MSSGNLSYPCKGFRQAKNFVSHYNSQYIVSIQVYQTLCQNILLAVFDANHCFTICTLTNGLKILIQRDRKSFSVSTQPKSGSYIGSSKTYLSLKDVFQKLQSWCQGTAYDVVHNNSYHLCAEICYILNSFDLRQKINQANKKNIDHSTNIIQNGFTGAQKAVTTVVTTGAQLVKGVKLIKNVKTVTNTAKGIQALAKVYQSSNYEIVRNISDFVAKNSQRVAEVITKSQTNAISSTIPVVGCLIGEAISNGIEMHKEGWKKQAVAKGVGNIAAGTAGGYGGFVGGAQLGAYMGAFGGPVGIAVGGTIGGIVGSLCGSWGIKKLMLWNR